MCLDSLSHRLRRQLIAFGGEVVFDPERIIDRATFENPHQFADGMHHVYVAGTAVLLNGEMTGARPGRMLRSGAYRINGESRND